MKWKGVQKPNDDDKTKFSEQTKENLTSLEMPSDETTQRTKIQIKDMLDNKIKELGEALKDSADVNLEKKEKLDRSFKGSEDLQAMYETRQRLKEEGDYAKRNTHQIHDASKIIIVVMLSAFAVDALWRSCRSKLSTLLEADARREKKKKTNIERG